MWHVERLNIVLDNDAYISKKLINYVSNLLPDTGNQNGLQMFVLCSTPGTKTTQYMAPALPHSHWREYVDTS